MIWTQQKLNHYLGRLRKMVEFEGVAGEELGRIFTGEAVRRLQQIEDIVQNGDLADRQKVALIAQLL